MRPTLQNISIKNIALLALGAVTTPAAAEVMPLTQLDEISGKNEYAVAIPADSYVRRNSEDIMVLICMPGGNTLISMHYGTQSNGTRLSPSDAVTVKFDEREPKDITLRDLLTAPLIDEVRYSSTLLMRVPGRTATFRFDLKGSARALEPFRQQCGA